MRNKHVFDKNSTFSSKCLRCGLLMKVFCNSKNEIIVTYGLLNNKQIKKLAYKKHPCITDDEYTIKKLIE